MTIDHEIAPHRHTEEVTGRTPSLAAENFRSLTGKENGQSLIEFAMTIPLLFTFIFACMELCLLFYTYNMISETAREGTRYAIVRGATCPTAANPTCQVTAQQVKNYVLGLGWPNLAGGVMSVSDPVFPDLSQAVGSRVRVKIRYVFPITMPLIPSTSISMSTTSEMKIVQ